MSLPLPISNLASKIIVTGVDVGFSLKAAPYFVRLNAHFGVSRREKGIKARNYIE